MKNKRFTFLVLATLGLIIFFCVVAGVVMGISVLRNEAEKTQLAKEQQTREVLKQSVAELKSNGQLKLESIDCSKQSIDTKTFACHRLTSPIEIDIQGESIDKQEFTENLYTYYFFNQRQFEEQNLNLSIYVTSENLTEIVTDLVLKIPAKDKEYKLLFEQGGEKNTKTKTFEIPINSSIKIVFQIENNQIYGVDNYVNVWLKDSDAVTIDDYLVVNKKVKSYKVEKELTNISGTKYFEIESSGKWNTKVYILQN